MFRSEFFTSWNVHRLQADASPRPRGISRAALVISILMGLNLPVPQTALGETDKSTVCQGFLYKAKKDGVPVYKEPDRSSEVLVTLTIGEKVCYVGEQGEFVIVDWNRTALEKKHERVKQKFSELVYVRSAELWPTKEHLSGARKRGGIFDSIVRSFRYWQSGGVPEEGVVPYQPAIDAMSDTVKPPPTANDETGQKSKGKK